MGKIINVSNAKELALAIKLATGGETILLAAGDYGVIGIKNKMLTETVTIKSADSNNDASVTGIRVDRSSGFKFDDIDVHHVLAAGETQSNVAAYVSSAKNIDFVGVDFSGSLDGNAWNDGYGLRVAASSNVSVVDSTFEQLNKAATFGSTDGLVIAGNTISAVREGFQFGNVENVVIAQNLFTGFTPNFAAGDHSDAIQFLNAGSVGSRHVVIRDNAILMGANGGTHGIFIGAENAASRHFDFLIENNLYNGEARHGISLYGVDDSIVRGNTVTSAVNAKLEAGINYGLTNNVKIDHNITPLLLESGKNTGAVVGDNIDLWDAKSKRGVALEDVFDTMPRGTALDAYLLKASGGTPNPHTGFVGFDGIGSAEFELANLQQYGGIAHVIAHLIFA